MLPYGPPHQFIPLLFGVLYVMWKKESLLTYGLDFMQRHVCYLTFFKPGVPHFHVVLAPHINSELDFLAVHIMNVSLG